MFITLEGIEGSGKSTLLSGLTQRLGSAGREVLTTREPGGTPVGDAIRRVVLVERFHVAPLTEALLMNASRAALVAEVIRPALAAGKTVLCDRYYDSTLAYQGYGRGLDLAMLRELCHSATDGLDPDLTFVLDIDPALSVRRLAGRSKANDRIDDESPGFFERARAGFLELATREPRMRVLDGSLAPEALLEEAMRCISTS